MKKFAAALVSALSLITLLAGAVCAEPADNAAGKSEEKESKAKRKKPKATWVDVVSGFASARIDKKPVIVDFTTDWCGWCKVMERQTFSNPDVIQVMTNFVLVRANAEDGGAGQELAQKYHIDGYPTVMLFDAEGAPKAQLVGFKQPQPFMEALNNYLAGKPVGDNPGQ